MKLPNINKPLKFTIMSFFVISLFVASYISFVGYQPKALGELREVKGFKTENADSLEMPYPRYATGIAQDKSINSNKYTFQTDKSPAEIQQFYNNILSDEGWRIKREGSSDSFTTVEYRKDNILVKVWAYYDQDAKFTFASVEAIRLVD
ncbi:hypothetical protein A2V49_04645 [candidate division WWE3 bacterium RBG_19FT_COMBO_34_6]|uniref:Uncharacterized protein n=1 Tax=candidate division WWE3 bacterium RBG_19FT_COMBO_34_6 TaxID=1802612 RepID=A0A1F4UPY7_UNCKA|nr:MAG: hypothetical protein A2V49_04645 [candidate division WWE3 bacterium RBG_19FT_COMBO_34_6]